MAKKAFAAGKRSIVYLEDNVVIKKEHPKSKAINRINNEAYWLDILNRHHIGPTLLGATENEIRMELVKGEPIISWLKSSAKQDIKKVLVKIVKQCRMLDRLHVNKYEMTNPYKHILIENNNPVMIDFERCRYSERPKNVTQFCQFLMSGKITGILHGKGIMLDKNSFMLALHGYKIRPSEKTFGLVLGLLS